MSYVEQSLKKGVNTFPLSSGGSTPPLELSSYLGGPDSNPVELPCLVPVGSKPFNRPMWTLEGDYIGDDYGLLKICVGEPIVIDKLGFYKCRNGRILEVVTLSSPSIYSVRSACDMYSWTIKGEYVFGMNNQELDLVEYIGPVREGTK